MEHFGKTFCLDVKGDYACFTRPEMKVERVRCDYTFSGKSYILRNFLETRYQVERQEN